MPWNTGISGATLRIAGCNDNPLRIMAGPGTGKSFAMQRRVARLLEADRVNPHRILVVTFTRNAASNLVQDLRGIGVTGCDQIRSGTLHAFCFNLLARLSVLEYLDRVARPLITFNKSGVSQFEYQPLFADIDRGRAFGGKRKCTKRIRAFEAAWARLQGDDPGWPADPIDRSFHDHLLNWLKFHKGLLLGELVPESLRYLRNNPSSQELRSFDHVIVDEYQDLNKAEQILLDLLASSGNLSIVGDIDQSIYSFRHANPTGIIEFSTRHLSSHDEPLDECRRCPQRVVVLADHLIRNNHPSAPAIRLRPLAGNPDGEVHIIQWDSLNQETQGLAKYIKHLIQHKGYQAKDILVLSPRRLLGYGIRDALVLAGVSTHSFYHEEALEPIEAQRAFTLLILLVRPEDRVSLRFWLGLESPTHNSGEYAKLRRHCEASGESPREALTKLLASQLRITGTKTIQRRFAELQQISIHIRSFSCEQLVDFLFPDGQDWSKPIREAALLVVPKVTSQSELLEELRIQLTQPEMPDEGDYVRVMSLHKSKGLTSKVAIVAGCIEGLIPTKDRDHTPLEARDNLEEQRRLFYVAMTRCREILVLSSVTQIPISIGFKIGATVRSGRTTSSRFLGELGPTAPRAIRGIGWTY